MDKKIIQVKDSIPWVCLVIMAVHHDVYETYDTVESNEAVFEKYKISCFRTLRK